MSFLPQKKRKALAVTSLVVGLVTLITTVILAIAEVIRDFGFQVREFMKHGENLFEFAITMLVSLGLIFLPVIAIALGTVALWKAYKNSSLYGARVIAVVGIILNLVSGLAYLLLLLYAIEHARATTTRNVNLANTATNTGTVNKEVELDKEAEREAEKWWKAAAVKCGEHHYIYGDWKEAPKDDPDDIVDRQGLFQLKQAAHVLEEYKTPIPEADKVRLGAEWWGEVRVTAGSHRVYDEAARKWSDWRNGVPHFKNPLSKKEDEVLRAKLERRRGRWQLTELGEPLKNLDCSKLPK